MKLSANIDDYSEFTSTVWKGPPTHSITLWEKEVAICALGLAGESGEVVEKVKKQLHYGKYPQIADLVKELGDVVYYWARLCRLYGIFPSDVLTANEDKLTDRLERGVLHGEGSNR